MTQKTLLEQLKSADSGKSSRAAKKLRQLRAVKVLPELLGMAVGNDFEASCAALSVLPSYGENEFICGFLLKRLKSKSQDVRERAAAALKDCHQVRAIPTLKSLATHDSCLGVRVLSLHALRRTLELNRSFMDELRPVFEDASRAPIQQIRVAGFQGLLALPGSRNAEDLRRAMKDPDPMVSKVHGPSWAESVAAWKFKVHRNPNGKRGGHP